MSKVSEYMDSLLDDIRTAWYYLEDEDDAGKASDVFRQISEDIKEVQRLAKIEERKDIELWTIVAVDHFREQAEILESAYKSKSIR